jgi:hypothetical protein
MFAVYFANDRPRLGLRVGTEEESNREPETAAIVFEISGCDTTFGTAAMSTAGASLPRHHRAEVPETR